jgi:hypothetical protein
VQLSETETRSVFPLRLPEERGKVVSSSKNDKPPKCLQVSANKTPCEGEHISTPCEAHLENQRLRAVLRQRTTEQFQRLRSFEESERRNRIAVTELRQIKVALDDLLETVEDLQRILDNPV